MAQKKLAAVRGMNDLLPAEAPLWEWFEARVADWLRSYGYQQIRTPIVEYTELFVRGIGEVTDIVEKEMYTFADRKGRSLTLRPEGTASVARAFIENGLAQRPSPLRLSYLGPMFRYEKMQRGRYRQFAQIGIELLGAATPEADAEVVLALHTFLAELGFDDLVIDSQPGLLQHDPAFAPSRFDDFAALPLAFLDESFLQ